MRGFAGFRNWSVRNQPRSSAMRRATAWKCSGLDGGTFGAITTSAPSAASAARLSADIFSGITHTRP